MKKSYCNCCGTELTEHSVFTSEDTVVDVAGVDFIVSQHGKSEPDYDVCKYCVIDAITGLDDRPKPSSK